MVPALHVTEVPETLTFACSATDVQHVLPELVPGTVPLPDKLQELQVETLTKWAFRHSRNLQVRQCVLTCSPFAVLSISSQLHAVGALAGSRGNTGRQGFLAGKLVPACLFAAVSCLASRILTNA